METTEPNYEVWCFMLPHGLGCCRSDGNDEYDPIIPRLDDDGLIANQEVGIGAKTWKIRGMALLATLSV